MNSSVPIQNGGDAVQFCNSFKKQKNGEKFKWI